MLLRMGSLVGLVLVCVACSGDDGDPDSGADITATTVGTQGTADDGMTGPGDATDDATDGPAPTTGGPDGSTGSADTMVADSTGDPSGGSSSTGSTVCDNVMPEVTFDELTPIFGANCLPCHTTGSLGGHSVGDSDPMEGFGDSQLAASNAACTGLTKGECTLVRIQNGSMPMGAGCTGDPTMDGAIAQCFTQEEQDLLQAWIDDGQLPPEC